MAARVNSRFIIIMLAVVSVTAGGVAALWWYQVRGNVDRIVQQGDELFEQGDYRQAMNMYGRAIRKEAGHVEWVYKMEKAILAQRPETSASARELYERWIDALGRAAQYQPADADVQLRFIEELYDRAQMTGRFAGAGTRRRMWRAVAEAADQMLTRVPEDDPKWALGLLYRGFANFQQGSVLTGDERKAAEQDLNEFLEAMPNSDRGWAALIKAHLDMEEQARVSGDPRRIQEQRTRLAQVISDARAAVSDGPEVGVVYAGYLSRPNLRPSGTAAPSPEEVEAAMNEMVSAVSRLSESGDKAAPWLTLDAAEVVLSHGGPEALAVATRVIDQHLAQDERAMAHQFTLATLRMRAQDFAEAERILHEILAAQAMEVGSMSELQPAVQTAAAGLFTDIEYRRWTIDAEDEAHLKAMREAVKQLEQHLTDPENDPRMMRAAGKLALMEGRLADAAASFEKLIRESQADVETFTASAFCLQRLGELGLALERVSSAIELQPGVPRSLLLKAELELELGRFQAAETTARAYLNAIPPGDSDAAESGDRLLRTVAARTRGVAHDESDPVASAIIQAQSALDQSERTGSATGVETARATLVAALQTHPDDVRLLGMLAHVELRRGETESASQYITHALAINPEHPVLRQLAALARSGDPIDAAIEFLSEVEDEVERHAAIVRTMSSIAAQSQTVADSTKEGLSAQDRAAAMERAMRAQTVAAEHSALLREIAPDNAALIEYDFNQAIEAKDFAGAAEVVQRARATNADLMNGLLYEGRLELERQPPRLEQAVRAFQAATEHRPFSNRAWRGLALAYQHIGNFREAIRAYEEAYLINPNDVQTIRGYLGLLVQMGDRSRAMRVARTAAQVMPGDVDLRELWFQLEYEHNNIGVVLDRRREIFVSNPDDRMNAMRLALMLTQTEPRFDLIRDEHGKPPMSERQWREYRVSDQQRVLEEQRRRWRAAAERIVDELFERDAAAAEDGALPGLDLVTLRATLQRVRGEVLPGEQTLRNHIEALRSSGAPSAEVTRAMLALAQYQNDGGLFAESVNTLRQAQQIQDPNVREADLALADFLFARGQFEQAKALYEQVRAVAPRRIVDLRMIECAVQSRQFDEAEVLLADLTPVGPQEAELLRRGAAVGDFMEHMMRAMIALGRADDHWLGRRSNEARAEMDRFHAALEEAQRRSPANTAPYILRAQARLSEYRRSGLRRDLDEALTALDRAEAIRANDPQTVLARVEVHRAGGNARAAIRDLNRLLEHSPGHVQARRLAAQLHMEEGDVGAAIQTVEQAIALYPAVPAWHELLGNLLGSPQSGRRANRDGSAAAYTRAFELTKSPSMLARVVSAYVAPDMGAPGEQPNFNAALQVLQGQREMVEREPSLEAVMAHVLIGAGRTSDGHARLARSYQRYRAQIESGQRTPASIELWYRAAMTAMASMTTEQIESMISSAGEGLPDHFDLLWLARREMARGSQGAAAAIEFFNRAMNAEGADDAFRTSVLFEMSGLYVAIGEYSTAAQVLRDVVAAAPGNWVARNNLAFVMADELGRPNDALPHALEALKLRPNEATVLDTVGRVYFRLGRHDTAEDYLKQSLNLSETARTQLHLAEVLVEMGRFDDALSTLRRAAELNPDAKTEADIDRLTDDIRTKRASA